MGFIPDEGKALPPPGIVNRNSFWLGGVGWCTAMLHNAINHRPPLKSGVHRQVLLTTIGWFLGYHLSKYENYMECQTGPGHEGVHQTPPGGFCSKRKKDFCRDRRAVHSRALKFCSPVMKRETT
ncbi:unnamed protein product [Tetraodon nigroviridis]|uniref:(spotted green pufferfish) hypothetical protein n=1 Tax=Tetraodon nigroviridis TaxID=99883 RepID=Q4TA35_TETNG|nr:unnamed protein product [Tetraodon nigroviridis]